MNEKDYNIDNRKDLISVEEIWKWVMNNYEADEVYTGEVMNFSGRDAIMIVSKMITDIVQSRVDEQYK